MALLARVTARRRARLDRVQLARVTNRVYVSRRLFARIAAQLDFIEKRVRAALGNYVGVRVDDGTVSAMQRAVQGAMFAPTTGGTKCNATTMS